MRGGTNMKIFICLVSSQETYDSWQVERREKYLKSFEEPGVEIVIGVPREHFRAFPGKWSACEYNWMVASYHIAKRIKKAEEEGFDAAVVWCDWDPGVEAARHVVDIPVIGPGRLSLHVAASLGEKIGILMPEEIERSYCLVMARRYSVEHMISSMRAIDVPISEFSKREDECRKRFIEVGKKLVEDGAHVIWPSCMLLCPITVPSEWATKELGVPVIDESAIAIEMAKLFVKCGISQSRKFYLKPEALPIE